MADVDRENRPRSPFMLGPVYRPQINSVMSILHRITGLGLILGGVLLVWWLLAAASDPEHFAWIDGVMTSWLGGLVMILLLAALWYHFFTGVRHLAWDTGAGFRIEQMFASSYAVIAAAAAMTVITLFFAF